MRNIFVRIELQIYGKKKKNPGRNWAQLSSPQLIKSYTIAGAHARGIKVRVEPHLKQAFLTSGPECCHSCSGDEAWGEFRSVFTISLPIPRPSQERMGECKDDHEGWALDAKKHRRLVSVVLRTPGPTPLLYCMHPTTQSVHVTPPKFCCVRWQSLCGS